MLLLESSNESPIMIRVNSKNKQGLTTLEVCNANSKDRVYNEIGIILQGASARQQIAYPDQLPAGAGATKESCLNLTRLSLETRNVLLMVAGIFAYVSFTATCNLPAKFLKEDYLAGNNASFIYEFLLLWPAIALLKLRTLTNKVAGKTLQPYGLQLLSVHDYYGCDCNSRMAAAFQNSFALSCHLCINCLHYLSGRDHASIQSQNWKIHNFQHCFDEVISGSLNIFWNLSTEYWDIHFALYLEVRWLAAGEKKHLTVYTVCD